MIDYELKYSDKKFPKNDAEPSSICGNVSGAPSLKTNINIVRACTKATLTYRIIIQWNKIVICIPVNLRDIHSSLES